MGISNLYGCRSGSILVVAASLSWTLSRGKRQRMHMVRFAILICLVVTSSWTGRRRTRTSTCFARKLALASETVRSCPVVNARCSSTKTLVEPTTGATKMTRRYTFCSPSVLYSAVFGMAVSTANVVFPALLPSCLLLLSWWSWYACIVVSMSLIDIQPTS